MALALFLGDIMAATTAMSQESMTVVPEQDITELVSRYITERLPVDKHQVRIRNLSLKGDLQVPRGRLTYEIIPQTRQLWPGPVSLTVGVRVDGKPVRRLLATGIVDVLTKVVVTAYPLARNHPMTEADVWLVERNLAQLPEGALTDPKDVVGQRTRQGISAGTVLYARLLEAPSLVKRGTVVTILAQTPGLTVTARGQAKEDGARGKQIRVMNLSSKKEIYATVIDESTVRVDF